MNCAKCGWECTCPLTESERLERAEEKIKDLEAEVNEMKKWIERLEQDIGFNRDSYIG